MPDPRRHADRRNFVESILRQIPGFHGYLEKEYRRESDYLARTWMADRLQRGKGGLDGFMRSLVEAVQIDALPTLERVRSRLDGLINLMRGQVRGYSGFFDYVRVDEALLDRVYEHDMALIDDVESLATSMEQLAIKSDAPQAVADDLLRRIDEVEAAFRQRGDLLKGLGSEQPPGA